MKCGDCKPGYDCYSWRGESCEMGNSRSNLAKVPEKVSKIEPEVPRRRSKNRNDINEGLVMAISLGALWLIVELFQRLP